jgi:hypothetical protein
MGISLSEACGQGQTPRERLGRLERNAVDRRRLTRHLRGNLCEEGRLKNAGRAIAEGTRRRNERGPLGAAVKRH